MPVNYVQRNIYDIKLVDELVSRGDIPRPLAMLLAGRGIKSYDDALKFLNPSADDMTNPFDIFGMSEAADRVKKAIERRERVLIYGDYDCDGLTAISILYMYLKDKVASADYYVPKRHAEGYGLNNIVIDELTFNKDIDLIITVDCGITSKNEVEYIKAKGVDVVVTDHHEPIEGLIPDCTVVNAKIDKKGFYEYCGAGIAFKLVEAVAGRAEALKYVGVAAIGTIADIVPLVGENRIIAKLGLEKISRLETLSGKIMGAKLNMEKVTATDIMFRVAPRINALGRLGDASPVVTFFTGDDTAEIESVVDALEENNKERQLLCENTVSGILEKLKKYDLKNNLVIVLKDDGWNVGVLGIAASRIAEIFFRPVILFTKSEDGQLRGSARSNGKINIFDCLNYCADQTIAFGGHSAAAGVTLSFDKFDDFSAKINDFVDKNYDISSFYPDVVYDLKISSQIDYNCVEQLYKLEPCGFGNPTPVFYLEKGNLNFSRISTTQHIKSFYNNIELVAFNRLKYIDAMNSDADFTFTLENKTFKSKKYTQGIIRNYTMINPKNIDEAKVALSYLEYRVKLPQKPLLRPVKQCKIGEINLTDGIFGNLYIAFGTETYYNFINGAKEKGGYLIGCICDCACENPYNSIVLTPSPDFDYEYYNKIFLLDKPDCESFIANLQGASDADIIEVYEGKANAENIKRLRCKSDDEYREIYKQLKSSGVYGAKTTEELRSRLFEKKIKADPFKTMTTLYIMLELGLITNNAAEGFVFTQNMQTTLKNSVFYNNINDF